MSVKELMIRTDNKKDDVAYIAGLLCQIIDKCLRGHKENPFLAPLVVDEVLPKLQQSRDLRVLSLHFEELRQSAQYCRCPVYHKSHDKQSLVERLKVSSVQQKSLFLQETNDKLYQPLQSLAKGKAQPTYSLT